MSERPLLFFPQPVLVKPPKGHGGGKSPYRLPDRPRQIERLDGRFTELDRVFQNQNIEVLGASAGVAPEAVLVIETVGTQVDFSLACRAIGMFWLGEVDEDELEATDDFYDQENRNKPISGKLLLSFTNHTAKEELLRLWKDFKENKKLKRGKTQWANVFACCRDIRLWSLKDRLDEYQMREWWQGELENSPEGSWHSFEIELWHKGANADHDLRQAMDLVQAQGGRVIGELARIDEIRFLAFKVEYPRSTIVQWVQSNPANPLSSSSILEFSSVHCFRPIGCSVEMGLGDESIDLDPYTASLSKPYVAVLDGYPLERHAQLKDRIIIDDPDLFSLSYSDPKMQRHGTAMCSLVLNGELDAPTPLKRPIYLRPILQPDPMAQIVGEHYEIIPAHLFAEDLVHRAIKRMFESDRNDPPVAPSVRVVNLSVADKTKPFNGRISSWGRLLDWLAWKYKILFLVSVGNQEAVQIPSYVPRTFNVLSEKEKVDATVKALAETTKNRSLFSPADSINALSIGASHFDHANWNSSVYQNIDLMPNAKLMSPVSAHGPGFKRGIKPEILFPGGRQLFQEALDIFKYSIQSSAPGTKVASPGGSGVLDRCAYTRGTSNATALASNAAGRILELLEELRNREENASVSWRDEYLVPLTKAMIVHGASRQDSHTKISEILNDSIPARKGKEFTSRFIGYGEANVDRVLACTKQRATVLGYGVISKKRADMDTIHVFSFPLPNCLHDRNEIRSLTITLAWLSPIDCSKKQYRMAKLEVEPQKEMCGVGVGQNDHHQINRGTVSHNVYEGSKAMDFIRNKSIEIKVTCSDATETLEDEIPYGIVVSFEVSKNIDLPIYEQVKAGIDVQVQAQTRIRARA